MLTLGEINDAQQLAWCKTIEVVEGAAGRTSRMAIIPEDRIAPPMQCEVAQVRLKEIRLERPAAMGCVLVVIALIVTPEGFPLAYEVMAGNTADNTPLEAFVQKFQDQYGTAERIWIMDRGIPTEAVLESLRARTPAVRYLLQAKYRGAT